MNNKDFWHSISLIIEKGFNADGLLKLESYAEQFITQRLVYKRFSSAEQHGCSKGGATHVIASLLAGANAEADRGISQEFSFKEECELGKAQESLIENWAKKVNCWYDNADEMLSFELGEQLAEGGEAHVYQHGCNLIKAIGLDYYIQPVLALDRISLHNTFFPETRLTVIGFGRFRNGNFHIIVEQPYIQGFQMTDAEIQVFAENIGFKLINPRNWTFATPDIYLSDLHDENVIRSIEGNIFVVDCDIRINTPNLRCGGVRKLTTEVEIS